MKVNSQVNSGSDADTPANLAHCICAAGGVTGVTVLLGSINGELENPKDKIMGISLLHEFHFEKNGMTVRKVSGIGSGRKEELEKLNVPVDYDCVIINPEQAEEFKKSKSSFTPYTKSGSVSIELEKNFEDEDLEEYVPQEAGDAFACLNPLCKCEFIREDRMLMHYANGTSCKLRVKKQTTENYIQNLHIQRFGVGPKEKYTRQQLKSALFHFEGLGNPTIGDHLPRMDVPLAKAHVPWHLQVKTGFALPKPKSRSRFSKEVVDYVHTLFMAGEGKGKRKAKASVVVKQMRLLKDDMGEYVFSSADWLTEAQIRSLFSKMAVELKRPKGKEKKTTKVFSAVKRRLFANDEEKDNSEQEISEEEMLRQLDAEQEIIDFCEAMDASEKPAETLHPIKVR